MCAGQFQWDCDKKADCPNINEVCCAAPVTITGACPISVNVNAAPYQTSCVTTCASARLCASDGECSNGQICKQAVFPQGGISKLVGICQF
jgi:hypothetical protein